MTLIAVVLVCAAWAALLTASISHAEREHLRRLRAARLAQRIGK